MSAQPKRPNYKCPKCGGVLKYEKENRNERKFVCANCGKVIYETKK